MYLASIYSVNRGLSRYYTLPEYTAYGASSASDIQTSYIDVEITIHVEFERPCWDEYFMLQAELAKLRSNCIARQVGAVIVKKNRQIATGYNGTPPGMRNCYEGGCERCMQRAKGGIKTGEGLERCLCSHAESNAIMHCAIFGIDAGAQGATLYTTLTPCMECTKMAITMGIRRFVCLDRYTESDHNLARDAGIEVVQMRREKIQRWVRRIAREYDQTRDGL